MLQQLWHRPSQFKFNILGVLGDEAIQLGYDVRCSRGLPINFGCLWIFNARRHLDTWMYWNLASIRNTVAIDEIETFNSRRQHLHRCTAVKYFYQRHMGCWNPNQ